MTDRAVIFDRQFRDDLRWWFRKDKKISDRILNLIEATILNPFEGIGKPEHLVYLLILYKADKQIFSLFQLSI